MTFISLKCELSREFEKVCSKALIPCFFKHNNIKHNITIKTGPEIANGLRDLHCFGLDSPASLCQHVSKTRTHLHPKFQ